MGDCARFSAGDADRRALDDVCVPAVVFQKSVSSNAAFLLSIQYTVRPRRAERIEIAFALPCLCSILATYFFAAETSRIFRTAASEKAHFRCALPILLPRPPAFFPADSRHLTSRQYETNCWTLPKRLTSCISYRITSARILPGTVWSRANDQGHRLFDIAEDGKESLRLPREAAYFGGEVIDARGSEPVESQVSVSGEVLGCIAPKNRAAILIQGRVTHVMHAVFNRAPMTPDQFEQLGGGIF